MTIHENVETVLTFEVKTKVSEREPVTGLAVCAWSAGFTSKSSNPFDSASLQQVENYKS